ncbi:MAG TPA: 3-hydroxyacyl-CoA dehydrogenase NAD-binding domain-containing protein [Chloroflexota bacterium]
MTATVRFVPADEHGIASIVLDRPDDSINAINLEVIDGLTEAVRSIRATSPRGVIVTSAKQGQWVAGADLKLVTQATDRSQIEAASRRLQATLDELAWLPCTAVAAINGTAVGGGLELALACDYRVASDAPGVMLGQPEVNLGLVPAGGGTQRLPRLIGLERALDLILNGRRLNAHRAQRAGLLDEVVHPTVLDQAARAWAMSKPKRGLDRPLHLGLDVRAAMDLAEQTPAGRQLIYRQARHAVLERTHGHYPAPLRALEAVEAGFERGMAEGLDAEARAFAELATTPTAANLIWLFLATQRSRRRDTRVSRLGVVGAGFMGAAIAEIGAAAGLQVRIKDISSEAVARGLASTRKIVEAGVARRRLSSREGRVIRGRLSGTADYSGFARSDAVIEAVFEDLTLKRRVLSELESVVPSHTVIATNTSAIPIHDIARDAAHPERVVGMHFFSPAERMPLLEVVRPAAASDEAVKCAVGLGAQMGKTAIVVADSPGFYTSRVLGVMLNEAALLLDEGARLEDVDQALTSFGFPVGPFVLFDEVGLEVAQHAGETVTDAFGDRIPAARIVGDLVARGETGRKAGRGFYLWPAPSRVPGLVRTVLKPARHKRANPFVYGRTPRREISESEIQDRLVLLFVNEAVRCLDEGVLGSPTDGDLGAVLGLGFPPFRGGPFHYADAQGPALTTRLRDLAQKHGQRYAPAQSLREGRCFFNLKDQP